MNSRKSAFLAAKIWFFLGAGSALAGMFFLGAGIMKGDGWVVFGGAGLMGSAGFCIRQMFKEHALGRTLPLDDVEEPAAKSEQPKQIELSAEKPPRLDKRI